MLLYAATIVIPHSNMIAPDSIDVFGNLISRKKILFFIEMVTPPEACVLLSLSFLII